MAGFSQIETLFDIIFIHYNKKMDKKAKKN
jgi:hypothetical protein